MKYRCYKHISITIILTLIAAQNGQAIELYKYVNEDGVTVLDSRVPNKYVRFGYTVMSSDGRVLEVVERALTDEEISARDRTAKLEAERKREQEAKEAADANLLRIYSRPEDVIRARDSKLDSINEFINSTQSNLQIKVKQKRQLEAVAADIERTGGTVPGVHIDRIQDVSDRIDLAEQEIATKRQEIEQVKQDYARDLKRVKELYGLSRENDPSSENK